MYVRVCVCVCVCVCACVYIYIQCTLEVTSYIQKQNKTKNTNLDHPTPLIACILTEEKQKKNLKQTMHNSAVFWIFI